jgi:UDP-N-acetylmuramoylalanine--D-glutamate ligase
MLNLIRERFADKSIVLLGFGREGQSSYLVLRKVFPEKQLVVADLSDSVRKNPLILDDANIEFITGHGYLGQIAEFDVIFRSPGIPVWQLILKEGEVAGNQSGQSSDCFIPGSKFTSQTELFLECYSKQVTGITGTKGKSTTSSLIHHIFKTAGKDVLLVGNIGSPVFHFIEMINPDTRIVFEMSSHQLEFIKISPHISVLLNLFQEHLDAYQSYEDYQLAKLNITKYQQPGDFLIYHWDDPLLQKQLSPFAETRRVYPFSIQAGLQPGGFIRDGFACFSDGTKTTPVWKIHQDRFLRGDHNLKNILAALNVAMICGIEPESIGDGIATFKGLEHRLEYVGEFSNIHFYNDSIATIPEACMEAVKAVPNVDTLIAGGFDRGIDYTGLGDFLNKTNIRNFILVGPAGQEIRKHLSEAGHPGRQIFVISRFDDFKPIAFRETRAGHACVLSPAAASYDEFKNFEERGKRFRELIRM